MKQCNTPPPSHEGFFPTGIVLAAVAGLMLPALPLTAQAQQSASDDAAVEEIVVTGSYIRGTPLDAPSPVQVVGRQDFEAQGAAIVWDIIKNLEINSGSYIQAEAAGNRSQIDGTAHVNLRNLGENSTLTLINGKRMAPAAGISNSSGEFVNVNDMPVVMLERLEILTDGGSALYGADAVAGVVNLIPRTDFEGLEFYADIQNVEEAGGAFDKTLSGIWGWASDDGDTHFVFAAESFTRDPVTAIDGNYINANSEFLDEVWSINSDTTVADPRFGAMLNPAFVDLPRTMRRNTERGMNPDQDTISAPVYADPRCTTLTSVDGTPFQVGNRRENLGEQSGTCFEDVTDYNFLARDTERSSFSMAFEHTFSDSAEFYSFVNYAENEIIVEGGILNNTGGSSESRGPTFFLAQPGAHGDTDAAATIGIPPGQGLSVGRTLELGYFADRITDADGNPMTKPGAADITNAPVAAANGGINVPFGDVVRDNIPRDGKRTNTTETNSTLVQAGLRGDFTYNDRPWNYDVSISWSQTANEQQYQTFNRFNSELAANGLGGPNCTPNGVIDFDFLNASNGNLVMTQAAEDAGIIPMGTTAALSQIPSAWSNAYPLGAGVTQTFFPGFVFTSREALSLALTSTNHGQDGCMFYNPFLSALTNPDVANDPELMDWMNSDVLRADKRNTLEVFDAVVSGEVFDMDGGAAAVAFGAQYRKRTLDSRAPTINFPGIGFDGYRRLHPVNPEQGPGEAIRGYDANGVPNEFHYVSNNFECSSCIFNYTHERTVKAVFAELSLPFAEGVESQIAIRWEDYGGNIGSELSPKVAISWRPNDDLLLRASYSESFRAPNIDIVEQGLEANVITFFDPISNPNVRAGLLPATEENGEAEETFTVGTPAPDVGNEYADTYSIGFIWEPGGHLDGFRAQADYWRFEVSDRVLPQPGILAVQPEIDLFNSVVGNPDNYILNDSYGLDGSRIFADDGSELAEGAMPPTTRNVKCNPNEFTQKFGADSPERRNCVVNPDLYRIENGDVSRSAGSEIADLITLRLAAVNAGEIEADGVDLKLGYEWESDYGSFNLGLDYTHVRKYELIDVPGLERGLLNTGKTDAAGTTGDGLHVYSLPDNKGHITLNWQRGAHGATLINRHIGSYQDLSYDIELDTANAFEQSILRTQVDSYQTWDAQYRYSHDWANTSLGSTLFTFGILDLFDEDIPRRETGGLDYDATVFDPRGRRLYARILWQFQ